LTLIEGICLYNGGECLIKKGDIMNKFSEVFDYEINNTKCIFIDGSVRGHPLQVLLTSDGGYLMKYQFLGNVSSFCVESLAILEAIKLILEKNWCKLSIFTDSRSVLSALSVNFNCSRGSHLILEIKSLLLECKRRDLITNLIWIPAHCGIIETMKK